MMRQTFNQAVEDFAEQLRAAGRSPRTVEAYVGAIYRVIGRLAIPWDNSAALAPVLQQWRDALVQTKREQLCSDSKVRGEVSALRAFYAFAHRQGWVVENPAATLRGIARDRRLPRPIPPEDVQRLLAQVSIHAPDGFLDRAMVECFLNGLRNVEVCRLTVGDVRYDVTEQSLVLSVMGKGMHPRQIVLNPNSASFVAGYLFMRFVGTLPVLENGETKLHTFFAALVRQVLTVVPPSTPLFVWKDRPLTRQVVNERFRQHRDAAGLDTSYGPHSLRHTCGTQMLANGADLRVVQDQLGHLGIEQTVLYTKVLTSALAQAARLLPTAGAAV